MVEQPNASEPRAAGVVILEDFARSFGTTPDDSSPACQRLMRTLDFRYGVLQGEERDHVILNVLKRIEVDRQRVGADERKEVWEHGWTENLTAFVESRHDLSALVLRFIRPQ